MIHDPAQPALCSVHGRKSRRHGRTGFAQADGTANISYFGLMPEAIGKRLGYFFLYHTCINAWAAAHPAADRQHLHPGPSPRAAAVPAAGFHALLPGRAVCRIALTVVLRGKVAVASPSRRRMTSARQRTDLARPGAGRGAHLAVHRRQYLSGIEGGPHLRPLLDENATCHIAYGAAYPNALEGARSGPSRSASSAAATSRRYTPTS